MVRLVGDFISMDPSWSCSLEQIYSSQRRNLWPSITRQQLGQVTFRDCPSGLSSPMSGGATTSFQAAAD